MAELTGQTFAGYEILAKLGEGGFGAVYKARQPNLNRLVALKILAPHLAADADFVARFKREATLAASFNHPNLVLVFAAGESDGSHYMAMEFVEGETLRNRIESHGRLEPREATAIAVYVAQALQYAWNKSRLIHRDIKPENVFVSKTGEVKVGDLGLAKNVGQSTAGMTATGMMMGSPHYISPEQANARKDIDFRADMYSLGCTLYHMLTGRLPYEGDEPMAVMNLHVNAPPPAIFKVWPTCPMPLALLVGKMLKKNPRERHASYEELIAELTAVHDKIAAAQTAAAAPPSGTITFLFTDIEGSTQLWEEHPQAMPIALERHNQILRRAMESHGGFVFKTVGDAFCVAFASAPNAMAAALAAQRALAAEPWGATGPLRVRMALHTGAAEERGGDYFGPTVNRVARVLAAGHGGQILLSNATEQLVRDHLAEGVSLGDLGERSLKNLTRTERIFQVNLADMPTQFPTLRAVASHSATYRRKRMLICTGVGAAAIIMLASLFLWSPWKSSPPRTEDGIFIAEVAKSKPEDQVRLVMERLKQLNPRFDGQETHDIEDGQVTKLSFSGVGITDISPVRALKGLRTLRCNCTQGNSPRLADLSQLHGMQLENLEIQSSKVSDLSPLKGMPLHYLNCQLTKISNLDPLRRMSLVRFNCAHAPISDLAPLEGMPLTDLDIHGTEVRDLSSIKTIPLVTISLDFKPERDSAIVRSIVSLRRINRLPVAEFWKRVAAGTVPAGCPSKEKADTAAHQTAMEEPVEPATPASENWQDWMAERRKSGKIPDAFKDDGGTWVATKPRGTTWLAKSIRDGIVRVTFTSSETDSPNVGINLRFDGSSGYQGLFCSDYVILTRFVGDNRETIKKGPLPAGVDLKRELIFEFCIVGDELSCKLNGQAVVTCRDSTFSQAGVAVLYCQGAGTRISRIEVLNLDVTSSTSNAPAASEDGFVSLFSGPEDLKNWKGKTGVWAFANGVLSCRSEKSRVVERLSSEGLGLQDYEIRFAVRATHGTPRFEYRWGSGNGQQAVVLSSDYHIRNEAEERLARIGRRVKIKRDGQADVVEDMGPIVGENTKPVWKVGEWNEVGLVAQGRHYTHTLNGVISAEVFDDPTSGRRMGGEIRFGVGAYGDGGIGEAEFKDIRVKRLSGAAVNAPDASPAEKQDAINLLPLIDPEKDAVEGKWMMENGSLRCETDATKRVWARMEIPYKPPEEYDFRIVFVPKKPTGMIYQVLRGGGRTFQLCIGGAKPGTTGRFLGFEIINGKSAGENPSGVLLKPDLEIGRHYTSLVQVRKDGVKSFLDGRLITEWKTDYQDMTMFNSRRLRDDQLLGIGDTDGAVFHRIEVREVTGKGTFTRPAPAIVFTSLVLQQAASVYTNSVGAEMVYIPPGEFMLGSTKEEQAWAVANGGKQEYAKREGETPRKAAIKQGFWMGRTEVTVGQWKQFVAVTGHQSEAEKKGNACCYDSATKAFTNMVGKSWRDPNFGAASEDNHPVCCVSWNDAVVFCEWLTEREQKAGRLPSSMVVRLPTEAEWEYACRAGTQTKFWWGDAKEEGEGRLNWSGTADGFQFIAPVDHYGARGRNGFGLADMVGNVQEWCLDNYDPTGAHAECCKVGTPRVLRGGSFYGLMPALARCACRNSNLPDASNSSYGFRVVVAPSP